MDSRYAYNFDRDADALHEPGTVGWNRDWIVGLVTYAVFPVLGLLATQFPELGAGFLNALRQAL